MLQLLRMLQGLVSVEWHAQHTGHFDRRLRILHHSTLRRRGLPRKEVNHRLRGFWLNSEILHFSPSEVSIVSGQRKKQNSDSYPAMTKPADSKPFLPPMLPHRKAGALMRPSSSSD